MNLRLFLFCLVSLFLSPSLFSAEPPPTLGKEAGQTYHLGPRIPFIQEVGVIGDRPLAYILERGQMEIQFSHFLANESLDLFGVSDRFDDKIESNFTDFSGNVGSLSSNQFLFNFGVRDDLTLLSEYSTTNLEYGTGTVTMDRIGLAGRYELVKEKDSPQIAVELKFRQTRGSGFEKSFTRLSLNEISQLTTDGTTNNNVNNSTLIFVDPQEIRFGGLKSEDGELRILLSNQFNDRWFGHLFLGHQRSHISSEIDFSLPGFKPFDDLAKRDQQLLRLGGGFDWKMAEQWWFDFFLEGTRIHRSPKVKDAPKENRSASSALYYRINSDWVVHLKTQYYNQFLTGEYPFLLNDRTQGVFDTPYGYMGFGISFQEDYTASSSYPFFVQPPQQ